MKPIIVKKSGPAIEKLKTVDISSSQVMLNISELIQRNDSQRSSQKSNGSARGLNQSIILHPESKTTLIPLKTYKIQQKMKRNFKFIRQDLADQKEKKSYLNYQEKLREKNKTH